MQINMIGFGVLAAGLCTCSVVSQTDPTSGLDFVTITDVGNRDTTLEETAGRFDDPGVNIGGVDYEYRIAVTEVTTEQYFEFVVAYFPIFRKTNNSTVWPPFSGRWIFLNPNHPQIDQESANRPATMGWEYAARYVNWLHNGKIDEEWAFESGVYDTSTFTFNDDDTWNHQESHDPDARYWIPTRDEWTKAAYWDPNKDDGLGGYWLFQNISDSELIPELLPEDGGERNAGAFYEGWPLDVGSFTEEPSPWGVLDMAGGMSEHSETMFTLNQRPQRWWFGTNYAQSGFGQSFTYDRLGRGGVSLSDSGGLSQGLRIVSAVRHPADLKLDWHVNYFDISVFIIQFVAGDLAVDLDGDGDLDIDDVLVFLGLMNG